MSISRKSEYRLSPEYALLGFLCEHPDHGYVLHKRLSDAFGYIWHVSQSQTYTVLKRLEVEGFLTSTAVEQERLPTRQLLEITDSGRERFYGWLNTPTKSSVHAIRVEFLTRLYFYQQDYPEKIGEAIQVQRLEVETGLKRNEEVLSGLTAGQPFPRLAVEIRIKLLRAVLSWLDECEMVLKDDG